MKLTVVEPVVTDALAETSLPARIPASVPMERKFTVAR